MIVAWILYALLVGSLIAGAAHGLERIFRHADHPDQREAETPPTPQGEMMIIGLRKGTW